MILFSLEHLLEIHAILVSETGGAEGIRDMGRLESVIAAQSQHVYGVELYPEVLDKAAAIMRGIITNHPFTDGNKRTGMLTGLTFIILNDLKIAFMPGEIENFAVHLATTEVTVEDIASWLNKHLVGSN